MDTTIKDGVLGGVGGGVVGAGVGLIRGSICVYLPNLPWTNARPCDPLHRPMRGPTFPNGLVWDCPTMM